MEKNFLNEYQGFVDSVTSPASKELDVLISRLKQLEESGINVARLMTAVIGLSGESGEFADLCKKVFFHDKPLTAEIHEKLLKELGDISWYWVNACTALNLDPNEVLRNNISKLEARYPGGFSAWRSENRAEGDV